MSERTDHVDHGLDSRPSGPTDKELASALAGLRRSTAVILLFSGAVALFSLITDQVFPAQRPTRPLVALTLGPAFIAVGHLLLSRRKTAPGAEPSATPEPVAIPDRQTANDLWVLIIGPPVLVGLGLCAPLMGPLVDGSDWSGYWFMLGGIAFVGIWAIAMSQPFLEEVSRRGGWVPPGTARYPVLVATVLTALLTAGTTATTLTLIWVDRLSGLGGQ